jgi:hypothetical protein
MTRIVNWKVETFPLNLGVAAEFTRCEKQPST